MSERAVLVSGFTALPDGWPDKVETHRDVLLVSDGAHFIGSQPFRGGQALLASSADSAEDRAFRYHALAVPTEGITTVVPFVIAAEGFGLVESADVPAPFDQFTVGGARLPELPAA